jgi:hypothetical protein
MSLRKQIESDGITKLACEYIRPLTAADHAALIREKGNCRKAGIPCRVHVGLLPASPSTALPIVNAHRADHMLSQLG